jgi:hypothetical protein
LNTCLQSSSGWRRNVETIRFRSEDLGLSMKDRTLGRCPERNAACSSARPKTRSTSCAAPNHRVKVAAAPKDISTQMYKAVVCLHVKIIGCCRLDQTLQSSSQPEPPVHAAPWVHGRPLRILSVTEFIAEQYQHYYAFAEARFAAVEPVALTSPRRCAAALAPAV